MREVEPTELGHRALDHALDRGGIGDVGGLEHGAAAVLLHQLCRLRAAGLVDVGDDHARAPCREQTRRGPPDARRRPGDDGDLAREVAARAGSDSGDVGYDRTSLVAA